MRAVNQLRGNGGGKHDRMNMDEKITQKFTAEEVRDYADACRLLHKGPAIADMLSAFAERIEADEMAVPVAWMMTCSGYTRPIEFYADKPSFVPAISEIVPLFARLPSQAAQVDNANWFAGKYPAAAEPVAQPADSRRVGDVSSRLRGLIAEIDPPKRPATDPNIKLIAGELRSIAALAAQGQGEVNLAGAPSIEAAEAMGAKGGPVVDAERIAFEAWMRGHCWPLCATWGGTGYRSDAEQGGYICPRATITRGLWAAWRDRAALTAPPASPAGVPDSVERCMHGCYCGCCQACKNGSCEPVKYTACDCIAAAPSAPEGDDHA